MKGKAKHPEKKKIIVIPSPRTRRTVPYQSEQARNHIRNVHNNPFRCCFTVMSVYLFLWTCIRFIFCCRSHELKEDCFYSISPDPTTDANNKPMQSILDIRIDTNTIIKKPPPAPLTPPAPILTDDGRTPLPDMAPRALAVPPAAELPPMHAGGLGGV